MQSVAKSIMIFHLRKDDGVVQGLGSDCGWENPAF